MTFPRVVPRAVISACIVLCAYAYAGINAAHAQLKIEIVGSGADQIPIAIAPFQNESVLPNAVTPIVQADLQRSGLFRAVDSGGLTKVPAEATDVDYNIWRARGADEVVIGQVKNMDDGRFDIQFRLFDTLNRAQIAGFSYQVTTAQLRDTAHRIADAIYEKLTGDVGVFDTRIAYVLKKKARYELQVADADGYNPQTVFASSQPVISPTWSPDGTQLAYVSFENQHAQVFVQSLRTGQRKAVPDLNNSGSISAPAWSPDGKRLAVAASKDDITQIFLINVDGSNPTLLTPSYAIDTEPTFSPDGKWVLFTSDRGGTPQIYRVLVDGSAPPERLTFESNYNVTPHYAPDGKSFTFVQRNNGKFGIAVQDFVSGQSQLLTDDDLDESPSFAPNGKMILYATEVSGYGILSAVSSDGRVHQRLTVESGDVLEPAWGPLIKN